ncbi:MAG: MacB family efflux pump subunit [Nitrosomonadales bacterium]|nr:MacB family efflux pump subunit [Nitrosomonadales bacterium]
MVSALMHHDAATPEKASVNVPLIELKDIWKRYGGEGVPQTEVLRGISVSIQAGDFVAIVGASGSGKSTLMNILGCLDKPSSGQYLFAGYDVAGLSSDELAWLRREAFGFVFQSYHLIPTESARENVEVPAVYTGIATAEREVRAIELLGRLGLGNHLEHRPNQLSGGQQQRVSIARALMNGGRIILADEPTGALDSKSGEEVMALLAELANAGHTIILITHAREVAAQARRVIEIRDGQVVADSDCLDVDEARRVEPANANALFESPEALIASMQAGSAYTNLLFNDVREASKAAWRVMLINRFRTVLTLLGIVIGVASVIVMLAVGSGAKRSILDEISTFGSNNLYLASQNDKTKLSSGFISLQDAEALRKIPNVKVVMPYLEGFVTIRYGNLDHRAEAGGATVDLPEALSWKMKRGTYFTEADERNMSKVAVLGNTVRKALFADGTDPLGKYILLNNIPFQVIGELAEKGSNMGQDEDNRVVIPYSTASSQIYGTVYPSWLSVTLADASLLDETEKAVENLIIERHHVKDFLIFNTASYIKSQVKTSDAMSLLLGLIAVISLLVGGIGVMNIMLMTVRERTKEIGIRMATGARQRDIMRQFLTEAMLVSLIGGVMGMVLGLTIGIILIFVGVPIIFSLSGIIGAFLCALSAGLIFGYMPAKNAARLDPVVALAGE